MIPPRLFETFPVAFTLKPLLIGGKAMHYYGLRAGNDYDFLIPEKEFQRLREQVSEGFFTNSFGDAGIKIGDYALYASQFGFTYFHLERDAIDQQDYLVVHLEMLLFLKTLTLIYDPSNQKARHDQIVLMHKRGVLPFPLQSETDASGLEMREKQ